MRPYGFRGFCRHWLIAEVALAAAHLRRLDLEAFVAQPFRGKNFNFIVSGRDGRTLFAGAENGRLADPFGMQTVHGISCDCLAVVRGEVSLADTAQINVHALAITVDVNGQGATDARRRCGLARRTIGACTLVHGSSFWIGHQRKVLTGTSYTRNNTCQETSVIPVSRLKLQLLQ